MMGIISVENSSKGLEQVDYTHKRENVFSLNISHINLHLQGDLYHLIFNPTYSWKNDDKML